ncbi:MAG: MATE family efflux transporter [Oscillospiraceae bacterium]|nr:MATE family efflux transporter [Oscillospiraceae bacterium]
MILTKMKGLFGAQDMTVGRPLTVMMKFSLPLLLGNLAQLMYNMVNARMLGTMVSPVALAAVGVSMPIQNLFFVFFMTVGAGISIVVAQYFGAKDKEKLSHSVGAAIVMTLIATVAIAVLGISLSGVILNATNVADEIFPWARQYLMIMFAGAVGVGFYNVLSGILRGMGDAVFPLLVLICTSLLNILLNIVFVGMLDMEVAGSAFATVIAQTLSAVACLIRLLKMKDIAEITRRTLRLTKGYVKNILRIGVPVGVQQTVLTMASVFVQALINDTVVPDAAGIASTTIFVAAAAAFNQVEAVSMLPRQALGLGVSTFTGQNIGAAQLDRVKKGFRITLITSLIISAVLFTLIYVFGGHLIGWFIDPADPNAREIVRWGVYIQRIMIWNYFFIAFMQASTGILRGAGATFSVMIVTIIATVFMRVPMAYIWVGMSRTALNPGGEPAGIYWSMVICTGIASALCMWYYLSGRWKKLSLVKKEAKTADA